MDILYKIIICIVSCMTPLAAEAQISVGIRDTRYVYGEYEMKQGYLFRLEQSVYAEKLGLQYLRAYTGYQGLLGILKYKGEGFFGTAYNGSYYNCGGSIHVNSQVIRHLFTEDTLEFLYDSGYGYKTCFRLGLGYHLNDCIDLLCSYSTIPEYRKSQERLLAGLKFHAGALTVVPELSIGLNKAEKLRSIRMLMSMKYEF